MDRTNAIQQPTEVLLKEIELENNIRKLLNDVQIYFDYSIIYEDDDNKMPLIKLDLITINEKHNQKFLFHTISGNNKIHILKEMSAFIGEYQKSLENYEIEWVDSKGDENIQTSWFYGKDIFEILNKFFFDKDRSRFKILKIKLMPET